MSNKYQSYVGEAERATQNRVIQFFRETLGYVYLSNFEGNKTDHGCLDAERLKSWLQKQAKYNDAVIEKVIQKMNHEIGLCQLKGDYKHSNIYDISQHCYAWMRNGIPVDNPKTGVSELVQLIDWECPGNNEFAVAEEVWFKNQQEATNWRRADVLVDS